MSGWGGAVVLAVGGLVLGGVGRAGASGAGTAAAATTEAPKAQVAADARAFQAAQGKVDPAERLAAFAAFGKEYPKSAMAGRAEGKVLEVLLKDYPERTDAIAKQAKRIVKAADKGGRAQTQTYTAMQLADAGANGVDLPLAEKWAKDSVEKMQEAQFDKEMVAMYGKFKMPLPKPGALHKQYGEQRATALDALADVYVHEGKGDEASVLLTEASGLAPMEEETAELEGQVAYDQHDMATALKDWERAQVEGALDKRRRAHMEELYAAAHWEPGGKLSAGLAMQLNDELDAEYREVFPLPFVPGKPDGVTGGHTVLLELFTGSACPPCVGGDMAVDGVLEAYPRGEVVALAMDLHIPEPDPLANADTVGQAAVYGVAHTPSYVLDGKELEVYGGGREDGKELYGKLTPRVENEAKVAGAVELKLTAKRTTDGKVVAQAVVTAKDAAALEQELALETLALQTEPKVAKEDAGGQPGVVGVKQSGKPSGAAAAPVAMAMKPGAKPGGGGAAAVPVPVVMAAPVAVPKLELEFALVEDEVRYSGENGVRFHRMVVRALLPAPEGLKDGAGGVEVKAGASATVPVTFDPAAESAKWKAYLAEYAEHNDRFGKVEFLSMDTSIDQKHLGVAVWVQDAATHRVLQAAYVPVAVTDAAASAVVKEEASR